MQVCGIVGPSDISAINNNARLSAFPLTIVNRSVNVLNMLTPGEPAPWFTARASVNPRYQFDTVAGRYVVLCFFGSADNPESRRVLADIAQNCQRFDVENFLFLGVSADPSDEQTGRVSSQWPGIIYLWDFDLAVSRLYGVLLPGSSTFERQTIVLDQALRTLAVFPFQGNIESHVPTLLRYMQGLPAIHTLTGLAPVLIVPNVFSGELCRALIGLYDQHGGTESGYMKEVEGKTVPVLNFDYKRRSDHMIVEPSLLRETEARLRQCLFPAIQLAFQFKVTHIERYIVACYDAASGGHFRKHRDHTTKGTAHRRFAVTINLNAEEYEGGDMRFAEFGAGTYRAPTGGALVFSCCLMHEVTVVTRGKRYAFLPFLYDDEAAKVREMNLPFLGST
jgi:peroxiredoxin